MTITRQTVAGKIADYLQHRVTLEQLVDWAENALQESEFDERSADVLSAAVARLGLADVRAFGMTWEDCQGLLHQLGYSARVEVVSP